MYIKVCPISDKTVINLHTRLKKDTQRDTRLEFYNLTIVCHYINFNISLYKLLYQVGFLQKVIVHAPG